MTSIIRTALGMVAALALFGAVPTAGADGGETPSTSGGAVEVATASADGLATSVDDLDPLGLDESGDGGSALAPIIAFGALVAVLIFGLRAIRKQRRSGTRRRFPPIG